MWRPENWLPRVFTDADEERDYEAGADAMLEALKKEAIRIDPQDMQYCLLKQHIPETAAKPVIWMQIYYSPPRIGWLVFIPDEKEN